MLSKYHKIHDKLFHFFLGQDVYDVLIQSGGVRLNDQMGTLTNSYIKENWQ